MYDSGRRNSRSAAAVALARWNDATLKDLVGLDLNDIGNYITGLSSAAYTQIAVCVDTERVESTHGVLGDISAANFAALEAKISGAYVATGRCIANAAATIKLESTSSAVDDFYNGMFIIIDINGSGTGTFEAKQIIDYVGSTQTATVDSNWKDSLTNGTSKYTITSDLMFFGREVANKNALRLAYESLYSDYPVPFWIKLAGSNDTLLATECLSKVDETPTSVAANTLTHTGQFVSGAYTQSGNSQPFYLGIESATNLAAGQVLRIASNDADDLTLSDYFDPLPTGTIKYQIAAGSHALWNEFIPLGLDVKYGLIGNTIPIKRIGDFRQLLDRYNGAPDGLNTIYINSAKVGEVVELGRTVFMANRLT
jgi:hypothetical protein